MRTGPRSFRIWKYKVSHSRLLIRSPKIDEVDDDLNVDLVFTDVDFMITTEMCQRLVIDDWSLEALRALPEEIEYLRTLGVKIEREDWVFVIRGANGHKWYVGGGPLFIQTNRMDNETPIDVF
jgi:hypothetical protein